MRWPDGSVEITLPSTSITTALCIYLSMLDPVNLPPPPSGYRFGSFVFHMHVTDSDHASLTGLVFTEPYTLTLYYPALHDTPVDIERLFLGYLGERSTDWAILETEPDRDTFTAKAYPKRPGIFALLIQELPAREQTPSSQKWDTFGLGTRDNIVVATLLVMAVTLGLLVRYRLQAR